MERLFLMQKNDKLIISAKYSTKVIWRLINKHTGKLRISNQDTELRTDSGKIINPQNIADTLNSLYVDLLRRPSGIK